MMKQLNEKMVFIFILFLFLFLFFKYLISTDTLG